MLKYYKTTTPKKVGSDYKKGVGGFFRDLIKRPI